MRNLLLFFLSLWIAGFSEAGAQNIPTRVYGKLDKTPGRYLITIGRAVDGFFCPVNIDPNDSVILQNEKFDVTCDLPLHSFVQVYFANYNLMLFYADSANDIKFERLTDSAQNPGRIFFFGANAAANDLIANNELLPPEGDVKKAIEKIIIDAPDASIASNKLQLILNYFETPLNDLLNDNKISASCHKALIAETEQRFLLCCKDVLKHSTMGKQNIAMSGKEILNLTNLLYTQYDPFDKRYFTAPTLFNNIIAKCLLIHDGIIPPVIAHPTDTWKTFSRECMFTAPFIGLYDLAPNSLQKYMIGNVLLANLSLNSLTKAEYMSMYNVYKKRYLSSSYISIIDNKLPGTAFPKQSSLIPIIFTK